MTLWSRGEGAPVRRWEGEAPAKVNLRLRILAREADGYHQIETVFQTLELCDRVTLERVPSQGLELEVEGVDEGALGPAQENLAVRAARAYLEAHGPDELDGGVRIRLRKEIPHGAGLGGGSSDAAAVLRGLDRMFGDSLGQAGLVELGARLGADVGFFVLDRSLALGWGRGDRLLPLDPLPVRDVVVAVPGFRIATPWAYQTLATFRKEKGMAHFTAGVVPHAALRSWKGMAARAENAFEEPLKPHFPELAELKGQFLDGGAELALLSGSGSAVFGVFERARDAHRTAVRLESSDAAAQVIRTRTRGIPERGVPEGEGGSGPG